MIDLASLPAPAVVQTLTFEAVLADLRADLVRLYPPAQAVLELESEPLNKLLEVAAYRELLFRERVNQAALSNLVAFAQGSDLDHKGAFIGLARLPGEPDDRYRVRILLRIAAMAGNGTAEQYRELAMRTSLNVRAAAARSPVPGSVGIVLWLVDQSQAAATQAAVTAALNAENARPLGVPVTVSIAQPKVIDVRARMWREAGAPTDLVAQVAAKLEAAFASYAALGRSMPRSWLTARLHVAGIARVEYLGADAPPENTELQEHEYPVLGVCELLDQGLA